MKFKFILMRHAESLHNVKKHEHKSQHLSKGSGSYKDSEQYFKTKFSQELIDPCDIDAKLIENSIDMFDIDEIGLIITSPLNRCLATVDYILQQKNKKCKNHRLPEVIVEPLITSRISTAWSVGNQLDQKKKMYPSFNFEQFPDEQRHWILNLLDLDSKKILAYKNWSQIQILDYVSKGNLQTYQNVMKRITKFKWKLQNKFLAISKQKKILIVSHNCLFKYLIGTSLSQKGKVHSQVEFQHCDPIYFTEKWILEETYLKPDKEGQLKQPKNSRDHKVLTQISAQNKSESNKKQKLFQQKES